MHMMSPRQRYRFKNTRLKVLHDGLSAGAFLTLLAWVGLVASWSGHRPQTPTPATGQTVPYNNHGVMFITQRDLDTSHAILVICVALGLLAYVAYLADRKPRRSPTST